jgi:hypothetical protein
MKVVLVSYHYHPYPGYRSSLVHQYFLGREKSHGTAPTDYVFLHADWDHHTKTRFESAACEGREAIRVPSYKRNLSLKRVWSHILFSWKVWKHPALKDADLAFVCVPPSLSALGPALRLSLRGKPWILDIVDLWPEALPVARWKKIIFAVGFGWAWALLRRALYQRATRFVSHCQYFLDELGIDPARTALIPLAQAQVEMTKLSPEERLPLEKEIRLLVLGSINHVLDSKSLLALLLALPTERTVLEILGAGESKPKLLAQLAEKCPGLRIVDHSMNFDPELKRSVLARCHFGYNGYSTQTAIGITYKSIDFATQGLVFLNSVQGDLHHLVESYGAGFNYKAGEESALATTLADLDETDYQCLSQGSRKIYEDNFRLESFSERMNILMEGV